MAKKTEFIGVRVSKELRASLEKKAKEKGVSLSKFVEEGLHDTYLSDKELILNLIAKRKEERPEYWKELEKSPIVRVFEDYIATLFTEFVNPISKDPKHQPVILIMWIEHILRSTIKHFDSVPEGRKAEAASSFISRIGEALVEGLMHIKSKNKKTQLELLEIEKDFVEKACFHFTSLTLAKESYSKIQAELEKIQTELMMEIKLKKKPDIRLG